jgi:hypothetical protein
MENNRIEIERRLPYLFSHYAGLNYTISHMDIVEKDSGRHAVEIGVSSPQIKRATLESIDGLDIQLVPAHSYECLM